MARGPQTLDSAQEFQVSSAIDSFYHTIKTLMKYAVVAVAGHAVRAIAMIIVQTGLMKNEKKYNISLHLPHCLNFLFQATF